MGRDLSPESAYSNTSSENVNVDTIFSGVWYLGKPGPVGSPQMDQTDTNLPDPARPQKIGNTNVEA